MNLPDFLNQFEQLKKTFPLPPTFSLGDEDCESTSYVYSSSHCYFCFDTSYSKNCSYCFDSFKLTDCVDCNYSVESELLYECQDCYKCYSSSYLDYCSQTYDSYFCWDCDDCHDIFGCTHLNHKQYCIFNKQYTKIEYQEKIKELLKKPVSENIKNLKELIKEYPFGPTNITNSKNSDYGNHIHYATNYYLCFDAVRGEDCGYLYDCAYCKNSYDLTQCFYAEMCYQCRDSARIYNCDFLEYSSDCFDCAYLYNCRDCHNCFGCNGLVHQKFCILNKKYSEEEYKKIVGEIRDHQTF